MSNPPLRAAFSRAADWRASAQDLADQLAGARAGWACSIPASNSPAIWTPWSPG